MVIYSGCSGCGEKWEDWGQMYFEDRASRLTDGLDVKREREKDDQNDFHSFILSIRMNDRVIN